MAAAKGKTGLKVTVAWLATSLQMHLDWAVPLPGRGYKGKWLATLWSHEGCGSPGQGFRSQVPPTVRRVSVACVINLGTKVSLSSQMSRYFNHPRGAGLPGQREKQDSQRFSEGKNN